jgi:branched-chain amino acid transport system substrate-binding protein
MKRIVPVIFISIMIALHCANICSADECIDIGVISPASGTYSDHGAWERRGMQLAVEEINKAGGVLGKELRLRAEDSETNPQVAARKARRLIEVDKVKYLMGGVSSSVAIAVGEVAERNGVLYIATNQNSETVTGKYARRCVFRIPFNDVIGGRGMGPYVIENVGKKWYFMTHDYSWGWSSTEGMRQMLKKYKGTEVGESKVALGTREFSSFLIKARASKPDALIISVGGVDLAAMIEQMYEFGINKDMTIVYPLLNHEDALAAGLEKNFGVAAVEWYYGIDKPDVKQFVKNYMERWADTTIPVPTENSANGYMAVREVARAIQRAGTENVGAVIKALEGHVIPESESLRHGPILIREWDHQWVGSFYITRAKQPSEMKDKWDYWEIVHVVDGAKVARTKEENPVTLGPYPQ